MEKSTLKMNPIEEKFLLFDRIQDQCKNYQNHIKPNTIVQICKSEENCDQRLLCFQCGHQHFSQFPSHNVDQSQEIEEFLQEIQEQYNYLISDGFRDDQEEKIEQFIKQIHVMFDQFAYEVKERIQFMFQTYMKQVNDFYDHYQKQLIDPSFFEQYKGKKIVDLSQNQLKQLIQFSKSFSTHNDWVDMIENQHQKVRSQLQNIQDKLLLEDSSSYFQEYYLKDKILTQEHLTGVILKKKYEENLGQKYGKITKDSFNFGQDSKIYRVDGYAQNNKLYVYDNIEQLLQQVKNQEDKNNNNTINLKEFKFNGTYWTLFNNCLYASQHPRDDQVIFKYDLLSQKVVQKILKDREFGNNTDQLELANDQVFLSDADSVYLISQNKVSEQMIIEQLNPDNLETVHWWKAKNLKKNCGNYFIYDKIIYGTKDCKVEEGTICYSFNLLTGEEIMGQKTCEFLNLGRQDSSLHFVGQDKQVWTVNNGFLCVYDVKSKGLN